MTTTTRVRRTRADWQAVISRAERSALSTAAFCAAEGISTASFYLWRKRLGASNPPQGDVGEEAPEFLDLGLLSRPVKMDTASWDLELDLGDGVVLRLRRG
ncbi:IS66 family insertion sequence element accessory protein TnpB [Thioalkalicoccus limnaeus]|uniref:IS66 family insertion sequence element accessory protein TnpB n=1 Tax=Thioalkalicoccus limnaeus TaxID=120681 RepID=A0ABV4BHK6_9GAMM